MRCHDDSSIARRPQHGAAALVAMASLTMLAACSGADATVDFDEPVHVSDETGQTHDPLLQYAGITKWSGTIPVCFNGRSTSTDAQRVKTALAHSWSAVAKVSFQYSACPPPGSPANYIEVTWEQGTGWGVGGFASGVGQTHSFVTLGYCDSADCLGASVVDYDEAFKALAVHEIGHVLGFAHEQQRTDATPVCPLDLSNHNNFTLTDGVFLTSYYDPDSVMNYCRGWDGSNPRSYQSGYRAADRISGGDTAGAQNLYGKRFPYWLLPVI